MCTKNLKKYFLNRYQKTSTLNLGINMKKLWIPILVLTVHFLSAESTIAMSKSKSKAECEQEYDKAIDKCDVQEQKNKQDLEKKEQQCDQITDPVKADECRKALDKKEEENDKQDDHCREKAKETLKDCKVNAPN